MAISITSLTPSKNAVDVPVSSDISFLMVSDTEDIDITTIKFTINEVDVQVSAYYGASRKEVSVNFFAKSIIKYNKKRYSEDDFRYGQRDIQPSAFQYGSRYVASVFIEDIQGGSLDESFSFTIEEGIFYNEAPSLSFYNSQTQAIGNYLPEHARARYDKYSSFQQFVNAPGKYIEEIETSLFHQMSGYFVQTADLTELSTLYKVELGGDFDFQVTVLDDGTTLQIPPRIIATKEITKFYPQAEFNNDISNFYKRSLPTRLSETKEEITSLVIVEEREATELLNPIEKRLERSGYISINVKGGSVFTQIKNNEYKFIFCRITGISREGKEQVEDLVIIDNDSYYTSKLWKEVSSIQFVNLPPNSGIRYMVDHARPYRAYVADSHSHISTEDAKKNTFWKIKDSDYGTVLQQWVLLKIRPEDIISSLGQKDLVSEYELVDTDGEANLDLIDIDSDRYSHNLYAVDNDYFYIFDKREEYSERLKELPEDNGTASFIINLDSDELGREDTQKSISFNCIQKIAGKNIARYRLAVKRPDGVVEYLLAGGSRTENKLDGDNLGVSNDINFTTETFFYDLDILGEYLLELETIYRDGSSDLDAKIVSVKKKAAKIKYKLERLLGEASIQRMFVDGDQRVKILDSENCLHSIVFVRDNVLIDYSNTILYFSEEYEDVEIQ